MKDFRPLLVLITAGCAAAIQPSEEPSRKEPPAPAVSSSSELIRAMHDRYADNWYKSLRFVQSNTFYTQSGGEQKSRWIQTLSVPGKLRIDFEPLSSKSGLLILNNRVTTFDNGKRVDSRRAIQGILTLTSDVFAIPPEVTSRRTSLRTASGGRSKHRARSRSHRPRRSRMRPRPGMRPGRDTPTRAPRGRQWR